MIGLGQQRSHALFDRLRTFGRRQDAKNSRGQGKGVKEMENEFFTTVFDKLRLYERARGAQRGRAVVTSGLFHDRYAFLLDGALPRT